MNIDAIRGFVEKGQAAQRAVDKVVEDHKQAPRPKPVAHFNPQFVPEGETTQRPAPPTSSWWVGKSREDFQAAAQAERPRLQGGRK